MLGVLFGGALVGTLTVAWPIYLHFHRRHKVVQVVPSLRLFGAARRSSRSVRLRELLLLLCRVLLLISLFLLVAQPCLRTDQLLDLPPVDDAATDDVSLAIVIDDSLSAHHADAQGTRLDASKAWVERQLDLLPAGASIALVPTSFPYPTRFMEKAEALALLSRLKPIPCRGRGATALANAIQALAGRRGGVAVAAARSLALWEGLDRDLAGQVSVSFLDATDRRSACVVDSVVSAGWSDASLRWVCRVSGEAQALKDVRLTVEGSDGRRRRLDVSLHDALRGRLNLSLPRGEPGEWFKVSVEGGRGPWQSYYFSDPADEAEPGEVLVVLRNPTAAGLLADKILTAALVAARPGVRIHHGDAGSGARDLPRATGVLLIGSLQPSAAVSRWLDRQIEAGVRIFCVPTVTGAGPTRDTWGDAGLGRLPSWRPPVPTGRSDFAPLEEVEHVGASILRGLEASEQHLLIEPDFARGGRTVVATRRGRSVLARRELNPETSVWALGLPLTLEEESIAFHPVFPSLVNRALFLDRTAAVGRQVNVGDSVNLSEWFDEDRLEGLLSRPDGTTQPVSCSLAEPQWITVTSAGPHRIDVDGASAGERLIRMANYPRLTNDRTFERGEWERRRPNTLTAWLAFEDDLSLKAFGRIEVSGEEAIEQEYDLSTLVANVLALLVAFEGALLLLRSRRGEAANA